MLCRRSWHEAVFRQCPRWRRYRVECVAKARFVGGVVVTGIFGLRFFRLPLRGEAALRPYDRGAQLLRHARCSHWWGTAYEFGEPTQILCQSHVDVADLDEVESPRAMIRRSLIRSDLQRASLRRGQQLVLFTSCVGVSSFSSVKFCAKPLSVERQSLRASRPP
jgi:hypothetical protein